MVEFNLNTTVKCEFEEIGVSKPQNCQDDAPSKIMEVDSIQNENPHTITTTEGNKKYVK